MLNYSAEVLMSCLSLCVLTILVKQNNCLSVSVKRRFYIAYLFIIIAALSEWLGIFFKWCALLHKRYSCVSQGTGLYFYATDRFQFCPAGL